MFLCCTSSRLLHVPGCSLLTSVPSEEITPAENLNGLFCSGYEVCNECSPLRKMLQDEGDAIRTYCKENHFKYHLHNKYIAVQAPQSQWGIALAENTHGTTLYHKSTRPERRDGFLPRYHMQQVSAATLLPYFQYITFHDGLKDPTQPHIPPAGIQIMRKQPQPEKQKPHPKKGSKRYRGLMAHEKKIAKALSVQKVHTLIDSLQEKKPSSTQQTG